MKKLLVLGIATLVLMSCKKDDNPTPDVVTTTINTDKKVRIEVSFTGDHRNYLLFFSVTSMYKGQGDFAQPIITMPRGAQWTRVITQGNAFNYTADLTSNKFVVESKEAVGSIGFLLSPTQVRNTDDVNAKPIVAVVKVYANEKEIETYTYVGKSVVEITEPLSINLNIGAYK